MKTTTLMLARNREPEPLPLTDEIESLRQTLTTCKPSSVQKAEAASTALRSKRATLQEQYQALCISRHDEASKGGLSWNEGTNTASPEMRKRKAELETLDKQIAIARTKLTEERTKWAPQLFRTVRPLLSPATAELEHAILLLERSAILHDLLDEYVHQNGFTEWHVAKGRRLDDIAKSIKRFLGRKK